ncbi:MAG: ribosome maturation factor RimM [Spirochaetales bacterium]|jgi:16S rRNA processing protein RimM|nr:ribosome maturation factor RimM [Spirochaetales bacterium]
MNNKQLEPVLAIGCIRRSHGVRGFMRVMSFSGEYQHFLTLRELTLAGGGQEKKFAVEECKIAGKDILLKLAGIGSPEEAAKYNGWEIRVPREKAAPLREGEFYIADLCGCALVCGGKTAGTVKSVLDAGPRQLLELVNAEGKTFLIPFENAHVGEVDTEGRSIELKSEWLLQ